jgi:hypothetical protein
MKRILKAICLLVMVSFVLMATGAMDHQKAQAGGGINYKVTVSNPTDKTCSAWVMVEKGYVQSSEETVTISPGGSYTWETGALCPCGLKGKVYDPVGKEWRLMQCTNMYGNRSDCNTGLGNMAVCASQSFTIERKEGVTEVRDYDYGFRKQ